MTTPYNYRMGFPSYDDSGPEAPGETPNPMPMPPEEPSVPTGGTPWWTQTPTGDDPWFPGVNPEPNPPGGSPSSSSGWSDFFSRLFGGGGSNSLSWASLLPALATAAQQYRNSGRYFDLGREAADRASPVSNDTRRRYQERLEQFYTDPTAFLEGNPEYMANMRLGRDAIAARNRARGLGGSGAASTDQLRFLSDLSARYVNQERDDLMNAGGFQFDPANAARFLMEGGKLGLDSENAALAALLYPFGNRAGTNPGGGPNNPNGGPNGLPSQRPNGGGGGGGGGFNFSNPLQIAQIARQFGVDPGALFRILGQGSTFGIDPQTIANFQQSGLAQTLGWDPMNPQGWNLQNINPAGSLLDVPGLWGPPPGGGLSTGIDDVASLPWWLGGDGGGEVPETFWDDLDWGAWWGDWGD